MHSLLRNSVVLAIYDYYFFFRLMQTKNILVFCAKRTMNKTIVVAHWFLQLLLWIVQFWAKYIPLIQIWRENLYLGPFYLAIWRSVNFRMSFWYFRFSKKPPKNLTDFCPESKKWSNHKIKAHFIDLNTNYVQIILNIMRRCFYFVVLITFDILGQKFVKFFVLFLKI